MLIAASRKAVVKERSFSRKLFLHRVGCSGNISLRDADMAQLVEHHLAKVGVAGSNPVVRSRMLKAGQLTAWPAFFNIDGDVAKW